MAYMNSRFPSTTGMLSRMLSYDRILHNLKSLGRGVSNLFNNSYQLTTTVHGAARTAANKPINLFLNKAEPDIRNVQTKVWRDNTVSQLNTILIADVGNLADS